MSAYYYNYPIELPPYDIYSCYNQPPQYSNDGFLFEHTRPGELLTDKPRPIRTMVVF